MHEFILYIIGRTFKSIAQNQMLDFEVLKKPVFVERTATLTMLTLGQSEQTKEVSHV
jgi:hypothetical protein